MTRLLLSIALAAGLAGCGFHPRNALMLPADVPAVQVTSNVPYSELTKLLERNLRASGAQIITAAGSADAQAAELAEDAARLQVLSERWGDLPIAIDGRGRAQEYRLRYAAIFVFKRADGSVLVPQQVIELSRDYVAPPTDATGTTTEREILATELRREMAASILRRIDGVVRLQAASGTLDVRQGTDAPVR
ncbi:MAG: LPS assembly lipoprotein LptE [Stenotrophomonas sp.]